MNIITERGRIQQLVTGMCVSCAVVQYCKFFVKYNVSFIICSFKFKNEVGK